MAQPKATVNDAQGRLSGPQVSVALLWTLVALLLALAVMGFVQAHWKTLAYEAARDGYYYLLHRYVADPTEEVLTEAVLAQHRVQVEDPGLWADFQGQYPAYTLTLTVEEDRVFVWAQRAYCGGRIHIQSAYPA
jgi:hypothetical protein